MTARAAGVLPTSGMRSERPAICIYHADVRNVGTGDIAVLVTADDRERVAEITRPGRRAQSLAGRALLRHALERCTGRPAASHRVIARVNGKPECLGGPMISLTHDGTFVACAVSSADEVGIDVQFPAPHVHTEELATRYFSAAESRWLRSARDDAFYMLWVLKEAYLKALGCGLAGLSLLDCRIAPPRITATAAIEAELALYSVGNGFLAVASIGRGMPRLAVEDWNPSPAAAFSRPRLVATTA